jgi:hypothetical protein
VKPQHSTPALELNAREILVVSDFPQVYVRVTDSNCQVVISFYQPEISIKDKDFIIEQQKDLAPRYIQISEVKIDGAKQIKLQRDSLDSSLFYLQTETQIYQLEFLE